MQKGNVTNQILGSLLILVGLVLVVLPVLAWAGMFQPVGHGHALGCDFAAGADDPLGGSLGVDTHLRRAETAGRDSAFLMLPFDLGEFWLQWDAPQPGAIALLGSFARGDAGPFSDVDLLFLLPADAPPPERTSFLVADRLVTVNAVRPEQIDGWFTEPEQAVNVVAALRDGIGLQDPDGQFAAIQQRAHSFVWTAQMQAKADRYASRELVGLIEEAHKGLEGLRRKEAGRLLNARFGLSWLLARVMRIQRGILGNSDNSFYDDVRASLGQESRWSRLLATAFGISTADSLSLSLHEEVVAGLHLYCETARLLAPILQAEDKPLIDATVGRIEMELPAITIIQEGME